MTIDEFISAVLPTVRSFAAKRIRASDREDFVQDVLLKLVRVFPIYDPARALPGTFAWGVARHAWLDRIAVAKRRVIEVEEAEPEPRTSEEPTDLSRLSLVPPEDLMLVRLILSAGVRGAGKALGTPASTLMHRVAALRRRMEGRTVPG